MADPDQRLASDPIIQFRSWFQDAERHPEVQLPEAMCLATVNKQKRPTARMVLLKGFDIKGFRFFTNVKSPKALDLVARPYAALTFHWPALKRQVRVEGKVTRLPKREADSYFAVRPRLSQVGSWASQQSQVLESRAKLEMQVAAFDSQFKGRAVAAPPHWHGFVVRPDRLEFWQEGNDRLHDRWFYTRKGSRWVQVRLYP